MFVSRFKIIVKYRKTCLLYFLTWLSFYFFFFLLAFLFISFLYKIVSFFFTRFKRFSFFRLSSIFIETLFKPFLKVFLYFLRFLFLLARHLRGISLREVFCIIPHRMMFVSKTLFVHPMRNRYCFFLKLFLWLLLRSANFI